MDALSENLIHVYNDIKRRRLAIERKWKEITVPFLICLSTASISLSAGAFDQAMILSGEATGEEPMFLSEEETAEEPVVLSAEEAEWSDRMLSERGLFGISWQEHHAYFIREILRPFLEKERRIQRKLEKATQELPRYTKEKQMDKQIHKVQVDMYRDNGEDLINVGYHLEADWFLMDLSLYREEEDPQWYTYSSFGYQSGWFRGRVWFDDREFSSADIEFDLFRW